MPAILLRAPPYFRTMRRLMLIKHFVDTKEEFIYFVNMYS